MKRFFDPCRGHRQDISLLASESLSAPEKTEIEAHLAGCANCREYLVQIRAVTVSLTNSAAAFALLDPSPAAQTRWNKAIQEVGQTKTSSHVSVVSALGGWWQEVIWPWRRVWAGLAVVWILILVGNLSLRGSAPDWVTITPKQTQRMAASFDYQQAILVELLAERSSPPDADRQKRSSPRPRTERICFENL